MDKVDGKARQHIAAMADLIGAVRMAEGAMHDRAGTEVVVDILFLQKRGAGTAPAGAAWDVLAEAVPAEDGEMALSINRYFVEHPEMAFGTHARTSSAYGPDYTLRPVLSTPGALSGLLAQALGVKKRVLNAADTEAAKDKLAKIKAAFETWVWKDVERADRLARIYNDRFNNLVPRHFDGSHLKIPGASSVISFYAHQKRAIWRIVASGTTYVAHAVGAGKTFSLAAAIMEQKRLGLITKAMMVVPGHCVAQASREFLQLYPTAQILVADETNFVKDKRQRFLARAATAQWDCIIITHSAFKFIPAPAEFERRLIADQIQSNSDLLERVDGADRLSRKRIERMKEGLEEDLERLKSRKDDMLTIAEIGVDQLIFREPCSLHLSVLQEGRILNPGGGKSQWQVNNYRICE